MVSKPYIPYSFHLKFLIHIAVISQHLNYPFLKGVVESLIAAGGERCQNPHATSRHKGDYK